MSAEDLRELAAYDQARAERPRAPGCTACDASLHVGAFCSTACARASDEREAKRRAQASALLLGQR
jgi:hypothetical protein